MPYSLVLFRDEMTVPPEVLFCQNFDPILRRLTIKCQALQRKKSKKYAALDKQHSDADKRQRGRRREQDNKAQHRPRLKIVASECFGLSRVRCAGWNGMDLLVQAQERV